ncbi:hypothetical protein Vadar_027122 [Vaccinium darrowii]|uniref:Uncharacterized protein n=1 Tax=Vaccinium darrowii TaxID=229202 RepID=A0ACB7Z6E7_9ERIC|nr:hypothetical protein Vadar_027122 [Vaccinium darrowii]
MFFVVVLHGAPGAATKHLARVGLQKQEIIMEGRRNGLYRQGSSGWTSWRNEEFQEEDVWAVCNQGRDFYSKPGASSESSPTITPRKLPSAAKMIPRSANSNNTQEPKLVQQSAPVKVPDWSKIYGKNSKKAPCHDDDDDDDDDEDDDGVGVMKGSWDSDEEGDGDESDGNMMMMPPHEWVARKHARSQSLKYCMVDNQWFIGREIPL